MAFWGVEVKSSKPYSHRLDTTRGRLHISQATLGIGSSSQRSLLQCNVGNKTPVYLSSLLPDKTESCPLNLEFEEEDEVIFSVLGPRSVHLSGFYIDKGANVRGDGDGDETDSYGEDIGETESEHSTDFRTEDEYEDDFIDDNDIEMFSPSPRHNSGVVIEEIVDDVKPVNRNGSRRRIKRKYQISDSEDDDQKQITFRGGSSVELESNGIDALPNSSLLETKDESGELQEKPETVSKEKESAQGGDQVISAERENEHVQASRTYRVLGTTNDSTLPSSEVGQENVGKPKKKKKKDGTNEEKPRKVVGDSIIAVHKEEKFQMEGAKTNNITYGGPVRDAANVKPSNDKGLETTNDSTLPAFEIGQENVEKPKKKKKKEGLNEEKVRGVVGDCSVDVHKEDKSQIKEAKVDDITEEEPDREVDGKPSNDKGLGTTNDSTLPSSEDGQENVGKPKKKKKKDGTNEEKPRRVVGEGIIAVHKEDKSQVEAAKTDNITYGGTVRDEANVNPSNDKGLGTTNDSTLPAFEIGQENIENPKMKEKKEGLDEEKVRGVVGDCSVDVHKEDKSQMKEVKVDDITVEEPVREVDGIPSNDKGFEKAYGSALLAPEVGQEKAEKPKRKKKKLGTTEEKTERVLVGDDIVHNEDRSQTVEAKAHSFAKEDPVRDEADEKPSNDKGFGKPIESFSFYETGQENTEKPKKKKKKRGKTQLEEAKADVMVNVHEEDKFLMEEAKAADISQEVFPVRDEAEKMTPNDNGIEKPHDSSLPSSEILPETTEKPKKMKKKESSTKEGKTRGVANNDVLDVQKEDKLQMEEAKTDFIIQKDPVSSKADKKSATDKVAEIDSCHVVEEDSSERKKHRKKNKKKKTDMDGNVIMEEAKEGLLVGKSKRKTTRKRSQPDDTD